MEIGKHWETIRAVFEESYKSCVHFAVAKPTKSQIVGFTVR